MNDVFLYSSDKPILVRERTSHINHLANMFYSATSGKKSLVLSDNNPLYKQNFMIVKNDEPNPTYIAKMKEKQYV